MSSNSRRNSPSGQQQNVGNVLKKRPVVPSGQLNPQNKQGGQTGQQQANIEVQDHNQQQQQQTPVKQQQQAPIQQQPADQQQSSVQQQPPVQQQPETVANEKEAQQQQLQAQQNPPAVKDETIVVDQPENEGAGTSTREARRRRFGTRSQARISRNVRLAKMLQPKNAIMVLHELVRNTSYTLTDCNCLNDHRFKAVITVDGRDHSGHGRTKSQAKNEAAENALKYLVEHELLAEVKKDENDFELIDIVENDTNKPLPWQHVASFAIYKLFTSWGDHFIPKFKAAGKTEKIKRPVVLNPAKKLPENPELMCPIMLIHRMLPDAEFDGTCQSENHPNRIFSIKCTVQDESYVGSGPTKKVARRMAAYNTCHNIFGINYPPDVYVPKN